MSSQLNGTHCRDNLGAAGPPGAETSPVFTNTGLAWVRFRDHWKTNQRRRNDPNHLSRDYPICPATSKRQFASTILQECLFHYVRTEDSRPI
jgi:hypothetical protein